MPPSGRSSATLLCITVLLAGALLLPRPASAQAELRVGVKEGGNSATLLGGGRTQAVTTQFSEGIIMLSRRPGLILGGLVQLDPTGPLVLQSEALWIWKGLKGTTDRGEIVTKLNYLEVPLLAKYRLPVSWNSVTGHLLVGPTFGVVTQATRQQAATTESGGTRLLSRTDLGSAARTLNMGLALGGEVGYRFGYRVRMSLELRYRHSLTRTFSGPTSADGGGSTPSTRHQSVALTLGFEYTTGWTFL